MACLIAYNSDSISVNCEASWLEDAHLTCLCFLITTSSVSMQ